MSFINIEIKARTQRADAIRAYLLAAGADYKGMDHQVDTYFNVPAGRLKLRQGNIENALIYYERNDEHGPRQSEFDISPVPDGNSMKQLLSKSLGVKIVVEKQREIYYIGNVKFHIDLIGALGSFVEIEAGNKEEALPSETLHQQCSFYMQAFSINQEDLVNVSYSDILLALNCPK